MLWIAPFALCLLILVCYLRQKSKVHRNGQRLRCPPDTLPFLGNAIQFLQPRHKLFTWFVHCQRHFGHETFQISVPTLPPGVVINDPHVLEFILKNESIFTKGTFFKTRSWDLFGGYGIINANGELWKAQRKAGMKFFAGSNLDVMVDDVLPEAYQKTRSRLLDATRAQVPVDLQAVFMDLTTRVVGLMAYDMEMDSESPFGKAFDYASDQVGLRFQNPLWRFTEMFTGAKFRAAKTEVKEFGRQIVASARKRRASAAFESLITNEKAVFGSLIDSLMDTFSDRAVVADSALNFLSAGRDTTAQSLTWAFYLLMRHPDVSVRLREEIQNSIPSPSSLTPAILQPNHIPYTMAVLYETLRLYPPVPFEMKQCERDVTLPDGTFMPSGSIIIWSVWAMDRSQEVFGDDADSFRPDRWLDESGKLISKSPFEFPVFNGGSRACLGKKMAELMATYALITMTSDFEFEEVLDQTNSKQERVTQNSLTLPMQDGLPCMVRIRNG